MIFDFLPWWGWLVIAAGAAALSVRLFGFNGAAVIGVLGAVAAVYAKGRKTGAADQTAKQDRADDNARDVIAEKKIEVKVLSPKERSERFGRWEKRP